MRILPILLIIFFLTVGAGIKATHTAVNITTDSTLVSKGARAILILQNNSDTDIYCKLDGSAAVLNQGIRLLANGGAFGFDVTVPQSAVYCIHGGTGNKVLLLTEG